MRGELPDGYEVADIAGPVAPAGLWGFGAQWSVEPPRCGVLADPAVRARHDERLVGIRDRRHRLRRGGLDGRRLDPAVTAECGQWTLSAGRSSGSVTLTPAPTIDGAQTVAMATATSIVVEGGTATRSHADTVTAYLDDHVVFVTVVTDPGSQNPQLGADFVNALMVKTVTALRG